MRAVVIGAGVLGAAVAASLSRRGARVTVLEAAYPGAGTSGTSFAWVNAQNKEPEAYFALNHAGIRAHRELAGGAAPWFVPTGNLEWAEGDRYRAPLAARIERLNARDYPARRLTSAQARSLEPDIAGPSGADYAFFEEEAHVLPALLLARLLGEARDRGAVIRPRAEVVEVPTGAARIADGQTFPADVVVSCAGRWTWRVARLAGAEVPMRDPDAAGSPTVGFLATTAPVPARLARVLTTAGLHVRPDGGGRLQLQALDLDAHADPDAPPTPEGPVASTMLGRLPGVLAGTNGAVVEKIRVGQRAMPSDGRTVAGFVDPLARFYVVATHSGITLAPLLGELVASELRGTESPMLAPFRPGRFATGAGFDTPPPASPAPGDHDPR